MLHEILLSLAGGPSPLLSFPVNKADDPGDHTTNPLESLLSPAEEELLKSLSRDLGQKNKDIKALTSTISASHPSTVCRAVSTAIISTHLAGFQRRILEVEKNILEEDAKMVGAYNIVPLSAIVGAFDGWGRKLDWLLRLVQFIQGPADSGDAPFKRPKGISCTAAEVIGYLRDAILTGYPDIEAMSRDLVKVAETAWLKQVSVWVLYGRHPSQGDTDFFVARQTGGQSSSVDVYGIKDNLIPPFVLQATAHSILFIGASLNHIRDRQSTSPASSPKVLSPELTLLPKHLAHLSSLTYPIDPSSFSAAIAAIRLSISQNALQKLLPTSKVLEVLHILKNFFLLARGEFAVALITAAEDRLSTRNRIQRSKRNTASDLISMTIKDGEVATVLARTWTALASLQSLDDEDVDEELDQAREIVSLSIKSLNPGEHYRDSTTRAPAISFDDLLLPASTVLTLHVPSSLDLFLTPPDVDTYSHIHSYLLAIRRAHLRLSRLFSLSVLRREHPSPKIPSSPNQPNSPNQLAHLKSRSDRLAKSMRPIWASITSAISFLTEIGEYFQGEVIQSSWSTFHSWLIPSLPNDPCSTDSSLLSPIASTGPSQTLQPTSSRSIPDATTHSPHDPETLKQAHKRYLSQLKVALLLDDVGFTTQLRRLMTSIDHLVGLMQRLDTIWRNLGAEMDNPSSQFAGEEESTMEDLKTSRLKVSSGVQGLIEALRAIDAARSAGRRYKATVETTEQDGFVPWSGGGVDRLLLKFDYGNVDGLGFPV